MRSSPSSSSSQAVSPAPEMLFDPFVARGDHIEHSNSTCIIHLESSDKIFCPLCLEKTSSEDISRIEYKAYHQYIKNLFDALDQHGEKEQLRRIVLTILEIIIKMRAFEIESDYEYHDTLKVINKIMRSDKFNYGEFSSLVTILAGISIDSIKPSPLRQAWRIWESLLDYGGKTVRKFDSNEFQGRLSEQDAKFYCSLATIIRTYMKLVNDNAADHVSDVVFALYSKDTVATLSRKYYVESQIKCIKFASDWMVPHSILRRSTKNQLGFSESMIVEPVFEAFQECFTAARRLKYNEFNRWLIDMDYIARIHSLNFAHKDADLGLYKTNYNKFLKSFVLYHIDQEYGPDPKLQEDFMVNEDIVRTLASHATRIGGEVGHKRAIFYIMLNCVAIKQNSAYFNKSRVRIALTKIISDSDVIQSILSRSRTLMRVFLFVLATVSARKDRFNSTIKFAEDIWSKSPVGASWSSIEEVYCFEEEVFVLAQRNFTKFESRLNSRMFKYLFAKAHERNKLDSCLRRCLSSELMKYHLYRYLKDEDVDFLSDFIKFQLSANQDLVQSFGGLLPALLHESILTYINNQRRDISYNQIIHLTSIINLMFSECNQFNPTFDSLFVMDLSKVTEGLFSTRKPSETQRNTLVAALEFIASLLRANNACTMKLLQYMDFTLLGYMYSRLDSYKISDRVVEAVAGVLVAYDDLDYPLLHRIEDSFYPVLKNAPSWMLSKSHHLQNLSIKLMRKVFLQRQMDPVGLNLDAGTKACLTTSLIHMLFSQPDFAQRNSDLLRPIFDNEVLKYHPLCKPLYQIVPNLKRDLNDDNQDGRLSISELSFGSDEDDVFREEQTSVVKILDKLHDEEPFKVSNLYHIPKCTYLSKAISNEQEPGPYIPKEWEDRAYKEATQSSGINTQDGT